MKKTKSALLLLAFTCISAVLTFGFRKEKPGTQLTGDTYVYKVLDMLGYPRPEFYPDTITTKMIEEGRDLVLEGRTHDPEGGGKSKYISLYYVCTNCHNQVIEDPDLTRSDPDTRLTYAVQHDMPFLQGTTFYGIVNRESWYNDDYYKKYGDLVKPARTDVRQAIQLCAKECSKGRYLEDWEVNAILAYYYSISYRLQDILSADEIGALNRDIKDPSTYAGWISTIKSKYALKSPATFVDPPYELGANTPNGDPARGKEIFAHSCQTCHKPYGCSSVVFDDSKYTFNDFQKRFDKNYWWLYEIVRHGTYGYPGHKAYMPLYPAERMSNQEVEDLKSYFLQQAS